ncbi:MAG: hypothetical protein A2053_02460 [Deltaproteobacteria bacterium GWA2_50_8]|nr:MAG: hypothetical protein A2053_02460 [Deltaproteobacteria bacterium GWA2_50_8]
MEMDRNQLNKCLKELGAVYEQLGGSKVELGICGGAGLILTGLIDRTTRDIDTLFPVPWPKKLAEAAQIVSQNFGLPFDWINRGPDMLTSMGLPDGFMNRAKKVKFGKRITVYFASRYDQVFFKVYAAADRGGYHVDDLLTLNPTEEEMLAAARWCLTHDTSDGFKKILRDMYEKLGYEKVAKQI